MEKNESKVQYAVMIDPDHTVHVIPILMSDVLTCLQNRVDGYIQAIPWGLVMSHWLMVINEEGKLKDLPRNDVATELYDSDWDYIVGNAVLCKAGSEDFEFVTYDDALELAENVAYAYDCSLRD